MSRLFAAGSLVAALVLAGCSDATEDYCGALEDQRESLSRLSGGSGDGFARVLSVLEQLRAQAPEELSDEWDTVYFAWEGLVDAFESAGTDPEEYQPGQATNGTSAEEDAAIQGAAADLSSPRVGDAARGIEEHANQVCDVDLGL